MREYQHELGVIRVPDRGDSLADLYRLAEHAEWFSVDTETTGLGQYAADFQVRLVQMGTGTEAWVLNPLFPRHKTAIKKLLENGPRTFYLNMTFDLIALEQSLGLNFELMAANALDIGIDSRLLDPRGRDRGGVGHRMEDLAPHYLGVGSKKSTRTLLHEAMRSHGSKIKIADVFRECPISLPEYEVYAGGDILITSRLAAKLYPMVMARPDLRRLHKVEHNLSVLVAMMERTGMPLDYDWANEAEEYYTDLRDASEKKLLEQWHVTPSAKWGHTSAASLKDVFGKLGADFTKRTKPSKTYPDGQLSLDSEVLKAFAYEAGDIGEFARDILSAKRSEHYANYCRSMRDLAGSDGRVHAKIHPLAAATGRMSVTLPPLQQLPRGDVRIRGCLLADSGDRILTSDYKAIEIRVAAAVSRDPVMIARILSGDDMHAVTATALFGPGFNEDQRQASKPITFGRLYLGGAPGIRQAMIQGDTTGYVPPLKDIQRAVKAYDKDYRVATQWGKRLIKRVAASNGHLTTVTGRPLIVDKDYAAVNYAIQSVARDILAAGVISIHKAGLGTKLRLVVHDECVLSVNPKDAVDIQEAVERCMNTTLLGVPIVTESSLKGVRWSK